MSALAEDLAKAARGRPRLGPEAKKRAARLRARRQALAISPSALATAIGVPKDRYKHWEEAWNDEAAAGSGAALATILKCDVGWLVEGKGVAPEPPAERETPGPIQPMAAELGRDARTRLGERLRKRRAATGCSALELARMTGISAPYIRACERELPERGVSAARVAKWERALDVPAGWFYDETVLAPEPKGAPLADEAGAVAPETVAALIRHVATKLVATRARRRNGEWHLPPSAQRDAEFFAARYGVHGEDCSTLQAVADRTGLTRERVRQITDKLIKRSKGRLPTTDLIDRLSAAVAELLPAPITVLDEKLRPLLGEQLSVEGADRFARDLMGRSLLTMHAGMTSPVAKLGPIAVARASGDGKLTRLARGAALRMISACGAANIYWILGMLAEKGVKANVDKVTRALAAVDGLEFLREDADGWLWFGPDPRNRVVDVATKVLAVARQRLDVEEIQEAVARSRRSQQRDKNWPRVAIELPLAVLSAMLSRAPGLKTVQRNDYVLVEKPPLADLLSATELAIYELLAQRDGVSDRRYLLKRLVQKGRMTAISFQVALDQSPILRRLDYGVYALRGWPLNKAAMAKAIVAGARNRGGGHGRVPMKASRGKFAFQLHVTPYTLRNGVICVPPSVRDQCGDVDAYRHGEHTVQIRRDAKSRCRAIGLVQVLKAHEIDAGTRVVVELDNIERTLSLRRADE